MKYLSILILLKTALLLGQNIEIPESVITGSDRYIHKTPVFLYPHEFQIKLPETPKIPEQYLKIKKPVKKPEVFEQTSKNEFQEIVFTAGKFGYLSSAITLKYPESLYFSLSALHDDSFRHNDGKDLVEMHIEKMFSEKMEFDIGLWNCLKEIPYPAIVSEKRKKHTSLYNAKFIYKGKDFNIMLGGMKNSIDKLEETGGFFIFSKSFESFFAGTEIGTDKFADKSNRVFSISGGYSNSDLNAAITVKTIGEETRLLPLASFQINKDRIKFLTTLSGNFSFPQLWKQAGERSYLEMKNKFLQPEETYSIDAELSGEKADFYFLLKGNITYEKVGYQWLDSDHNNLYEPSVLKDNFINTIGITLGKTFKKFFIESNYLCFNREKKKSGFPEKAGYLKAGFDAGKFRNEFQLTYTGKQEFDETEVKAYTTLSALIIYQFKPDIELFMKLNNITGKNYQIAPGYPGEPFNFIAGFQLRW